MDWITTTFSLFLRYRFKKHRCESDSVNTWQYVHNSFNYVHNPFNYVHNPFNYVHNPLNYVHNLLKNDEIMGKKVFSYRNLTECLKNVLLPQLGKFSKKIAFCKLIMGLKNTFVNMSFRISRKILFCFLKKTFHL